MVVGFFVLLLSIVRIARFFAGNEYGKIGGFFYKPDVTIRYFYDFLMRKEKNMIGHNPLAGPVLFSLIVLIAYNTLLGLVLFLSDTDGMGLPGILSDFFLEISDAISILHEAVAHLILIFIGIHLLGLTIHTIRHKENIARSMITGYVQGHEEKNVP